jgi:RNA polymerase sigma-70 factor (ECF subfamily)
MANKKPALDQMVDELQRSVNVELNFRFLCERYYSPIVNYFVQRGYRLDESRNLTQETFCRVHSSIKGFRGDSKFETWLYTLASHVYLNDLRDRNTIKRTAQLVPLVSSDEGEQTSSHSHHANPSSNALDRLLLDERMQKLEDALASLSPQARRCLIMRIDQGLKYKEIAEVLQVSIGTVKAHINRARQNLRKQLKDYFDSIEF